MHTSSAARLRVPRGPVAVLLAALAFWVVGAVIFAALPADSAGRSVIVGGIYWLAAIFTAVTLSRAVLRTVERVRLFWGLLGAGLLIGFVGDFGWSDLNERGLAIQDISYQHLVYIASYLLLAGALLCLIDTAARKVTLVTALDALTIMISVGVFIFYFFLGPAVAGSGLSWAILATLSWPLFDAALLFFTLVVLSTTGRAAFIGLLACGFLAFAVADGLYLKDRSQDLYTVGSWPDLIWALGVLLLGSATLRPGLAFSTGWDRINPWRIFSFWLGPLSPPVHLGVVMLWGALNPPMPPYVLICGAIILFYMALRVALVSFVTRRVSGEQEETARRLAQSRILYELHDTVKQNVHGVSLTLSAALDAERRGDLGNARDMFATALAASKEAEFQISRPYDELQALRNEAPPAAGDFLRHRLKKFNEYFGVNTHDDLQASLENLSPAEIAAVNRVAVEAFWNVAKHSNARNMYLESRQIGSLLMVRIRDDGRGFDPRKPPPGLGLDYMRQHAREVGAYLDVISAPCRGTTIQLRFDNN